MQNKLFVRNLPCNTGNSELTALFKSFGKVLSVRLPVDRQTGLTRGFGFVEMSSEQSAKLAISELNLTTFAGRKIQVSFSQVHDDRATTYAIC